MAKTKVAPVVQVTPFWDHTHRTGKIIAAKKDGLCTLTFQGRTAVNAIEVTLRPNASKNAARALTAGTALTFSDLHTPKLKVALQVQYDGRSAVTVQGPEQAVRSVILGRAQRARLAAFLAA